MIVNLRVGVALSRVQGGGGANARPAGRGGVTSHNYSFFISPFFCSSLEPSRKAAPAPNLLSHDGSVPIILTSSQTSRRCRRNEGFLGCAFPVPNVASRRGFPLPSRNMSSLSGADAAIWNNVPQRRPLPVGQLPNGDPLCGGVGSPPSAASPSTVPPAALDVAPVTSLFPLKKCITGMEQTARFKHTPPYDAIIEFIGRLAAATIATPRHRHLPADAGADAPVIRGVLSLLSRIEAIRAEVPLQEMKSQRYGNLAFREFYKGFTAILKDAILNDVLTAAEDGAEGTCAPRPLRLLSADPPFLPLQPTSAGSESDDGPRRALAKEWLASELAGYVADSLGNAQRLDYGTGHELHFIVFLFVLENTGAILPADLPSVVLHVFWEYLDLARRVQDHYRLEPAGSHGVWGLDDHHHVPYILGAAQLALPPPTAPLQEGSDVAGDIVPSSEAIGNAAEAAAHKDVYLFFSMLHWIHTHKKGPFHEHSNVLFSLKGMPWERITTGMLKMFQGEVLGKHTIVQHLLFGRYFPYVDAAAR